MGTPLRVDDLSFAYDGETALRGVTFAVEPGQTLAVIGPNGSGKSTLLRAIAGLVHGAGTVDTGDGDVAFVLQSTDVDRAVPLTVRETVAMGRYGRLGLFRRFTDVDRAAITTSMERLEITDLAARQLHELSGGQRQRVFIAQGLAQEADHVLLDEPVNGLDVVSRDVILQVIAAERSRGRTVLVTTHNLEDARRCDLVLLLATEAIAFGSPDDVITEPNLRRAFGGRVLRIGDDFVMDDPHHAH